MNGWSNTDNPIASVYELNCFADEYEAYDFAREYQQIFNWHEAVPISDMIYNLKELEKFHQQTETQTIINKDFTLITKGENMNLNNLEDLTDEMKKLGFSDAHIKKMEEHMRAEDPNFKLYE